MFDKCKEIYHFVEMGSKANNESCPMHCWPSTDDHHDEELYKGFASSDSNVRLLTYQTIQNLVGS